MERRYDSSARLVGRARNVTRGGLARGRGKWIWPRRTMAARSRGRACASSTALGQKMLASAWRAAKRRDRAYVRIRHGEFRAHRNLKSLGLMSCRRRGFACRSTMVWRVSVDPWETRRPQAWRRGSTRSARFHGSRRRAVEQPSERCCLYGDEPLPGDRIFEKAGSDLPLCGVALQARLRRRRQLFPSSPSGAGAGHRRAAAIDFLASCLGRAVRDRKGPHDLDWAPCGLKGN